MYNGDSFLHMYSQESLHTLTHSHTHMSHKTHVHSCCGWKKTTYHHARSHVHGHVGINKNMETVKYVLNVYNIDG